MIGIHENGELKALNNGYTLGSGGGSGTPIPTADTNAQFDSDAHMNSTDMTSAEVTSFVNSLGLNGRAGFQWDYVGTTTGTGAVSLPNNWNEIMVVGKFGAAGVYGFTEYFIRQQIETYTNPNRFFGGNCTNSGNDYHGYWLQLTTTSVALGGWNWSGTNYASTSSIYVWAR